MAWVEDDWTGVRSFSRLRLSFAAILPVSKLRLVLCQVFNSDNASDKTRLANARFKQLLFPPKLYLARGVYNDKIHINSRLTNARFKPLLFPPKLHLAKGVYSDKIHIDSGLTNAPFKQLLFPP